MAETIVVGVDASASAQAALSWAAEFARSTGAELRAIHVLEWPEVHEVSVTSDIEDRMYPDATGVDRACEDEIRPLYAAIHPEPGWRLEFGQGRPGRLLVEGAERAALLVVGTREHVGFARLISGSTSHYCLNHSPSCPVVAVPAIRPCYAVGSRSAVSAR